MRTGAHLFFGMLAILVGVLILVQVIQFRGISGASIHEEGVKGEEENAALRVRELSAFRDGTLVEARFLIESERGGEVSIVYALEGGEGVSLRRGEQRLLLPASVPSLQRLRLSIPEAQEQNLFLTLGVSDGVGFAYRRVAVRGERGKEDVAVGQSAFAIPLSIIGVMVLVGGYVAWHLHHRKKMRAFAHQLPHHVSVHVPQTLR